MSDVTKSALAAAISAHFADEFDGALATDWVLMTYGSHLDNANGYYMRDWPAGQPVHVTSGLLEYAQQRHAYFIEESTSLDADEDDGD